MEMIIEDNIITMVPEGNWRTINEIYGYKPKTTFYDDFKIAEAFGPQAMADTYRRAFAEWKNNVVYITELAMVLN